LRKNKKGISPLIATVLLIGFAVAIAILVWFWYGNVIKEQAEKTGATSQGKLACASEVKYTIKNACYSSSGTTNNILFTIENKGTSIDDLRVRIEGTSSTETVSLGNSIGTTETKQTSAQYSSAVGNVKKVAFSPIVFRQNAPTVCSDKEQELNVKPCP